MEKTILEQMDSIYEQQGDYLISCLALPAEKIDRNFLGGTTFALS